MYEVLSQRVLYRPKKENKVFDKIFLLFSPVKLITELYLIILLHLSRNNIPSIPCFDLFLVLDL